VFFSRGKTGGKADFRLVNISGGQKEKIAKVYSKDFSQRFPEGLKGVGIISPDSSEPLFFFLMAKERGPMRK